MKIRGPLAVALCLALTTPAWASRRVAPPQGVVSVDAGTDTLAVWPYTTSDFENGSDPVNLVFPNADPRAIRQELMRLDGDRPAFASLPLGAGACTWMDAMGYEQAAWAEPEGWVGGSVQLACVASSAQPLGSPFRVHVRLFRSGAHTLGAAHFEILIPGTAEHEVLSWDLARQFTLYDMNRTDTLTAPPSESPLIAPGVFRAVRRPVYDALVAAGLGPLLSGLGLAAPSSGDVPIPTTGRAAVLATGISFEPGRSKLAAATDVTYDVVVPRPFCASGPSDLVRLEGPLHFAQSVHTNRSGRYERRYLIGGTLQVTPVRPTSPTTFEPTGETVDACISEAHRAVLTDHLGQVTERVSQVLLDEDQPSLQWTFGAGRWDRYLREVFCGTP